MANTNCLEGIRCPKCGSHEPFYIGPVEVTLKVHDDGTEPTGDVEWHDATGITCEACHHSGVVADFRRPYRRINTGGYRGQGGLGLPYAVGLVGAGNLIRRQFATEAEAAAYIEMLPDAGDGRYYLDGPEAGVSISAEAHSDDRVVEVEFDAAPWFTQASAEQIVALARCGWGGDYPADAVAFWMAEHHGNVQRLFTYLDTIADGPTSCGFECNMNKEEALAWLAEHRPEVHEAIKREGSD